MSRTAPTGNVMQGGNTSGVSSVGQQVVPGAVSPVGGMNSGKLFDLDFFNVTKEYYCKCVFFSVHFLTNCSSFQLIIFTKILSSF